MDYYGKYAIVICALLAVSLNIFQSLPEEEFITQGEMLLKYEIKENIRSLLLVLILLV